MNWTGLLNIAGQTRSYDGRKKKGAIVFDSAFENVSKSTQVTLVSAASIWTTL